MVQHTKLNKQSRETNKMYTPIEIRRYGRVGSETWSYEIWHGLRCYGISSHRQSMHFNIQYARSCAQDPEFIPISEPDKADQHMRAAAQSLASQIKLIFKRDPIIDCTKLDSRSFKQ